LRPRLRPRPRSPARPFVVAQRADGLGLLGAKPSLRGSRCPGDAFRCDGRSRSPATHPATEPAPESRSERGFASRGFGTRAPVASVLFPAQGRSAGGFRLLTMSTANGIRTRVTAVRGRRPSPLDDGGQVLAVEASKGTRRSAAARAFGLYAPLRRHLLVERGEVRVAARGPARALDGGDLGFGGAPRGGEDGLDARARGAVARDRVLPAPPSGRRFGRALRARPDRVARAVCAAVRVADVQPVVVPSVERLARKSRPAAASGRLVQTRYEHRFDASDARRMAHSC
jgi:hypothetical protein